MGGAQRRLLPSEQNIEASVLIWLDVKVNKLQENVDAQQRLGKLLQTFKAFSNESECETFIRSQPKDTKAILIVSGTLGETFVPAIHNNSAVAGIYIYCGDKNKHGWTEKHPKIRNKAVNLQELIHQIRSDQPKQQNEQNEDSLTYTTFNDKPSKDKLTIALNGEFVHLQLFIDCLLLIQPTASDFDELISICRNQYATDSEQLALIEQFKRGYSGEAAVCWYTRESFLYKMLNQALRQREVHMIYLFRFLIRDLQTQLHARRCSSPLTVFRGQLMSRKELHALEIAEGELISINSFLSTSRHRATAYSFLTKREQFESVLFEIEADPRVPGSTPFAEISAYSYFKREAEVLFMLGSIFRIGKASWDRNAVCTVKLQLYGHDDRTLQGILDYEKAQLKSMELDLLRLGEVLRMMQQYDLAKMFYQRCLDTLQPHEHHHMAACYFALGELANQQDHYPTNLEYYQKSLEADEKSEKPNESNIALTHNSIANVYQRRGDRQRALPFYEKALKIFRRVHGSTHANVAMCLNNIGALYQDNDKHAEALDYFQKALAIRLECLPRYHSDTGESHNNIGTAYRHLQRPRDALAQYDTALKIYTVTLSPDDPAIAITHENTGNVHAQEGRRNEALVHYRKAEEIFRKTRPDQHDDLTRIKGKIQRVSPV